MEAKVVDPLTGELLSPDQRGELWVRGPTTMKVNTFVITMKIFWQVRFPQLSWNIYLSNSDDADAAVVP
ncbi:hypothetical protein Dsin_031471 [Dipteronia sinensis]|uniref:Uncharacterized protein n=1 Tax=Dipteronia sinensis TaxID=43782 RepID=A0AAD9ZMI1_9ROSI|nr:hypothetical protein Dsin_031471 [Dipteronia sinensis]